MGKREWSGRVDTGTKACSGWFLSYHVRRNRVGGHLVHRGAPKPARGRATPCGKTYGGERRIEVAVGEFFCESIFDYGEKVVRLLAYEVEHVSGEIAPTDHDCVLWVTVVQLSNFDWAPADLPFVEQLKNEIY